MTNYNARLDEILIRFAGAIRREVLALESNDPSYDVQPLFSPAKQAITSLIKELVAEAKPKEVDSFYEKPIVDQFEQNLLKALEEAMAKPTKLTKSQQQKLKNASKSFQKMEADIRPFVRKRQIIQVSTGGKWRAAMTPTEQDNELDLSHLKDTRAVLRWCYDHGLLKGEFPTSDSSDKAYLLEQGEKRLMQLITADRKRVALDARLDELIWSTGVTYKYDKDRQIVQDRIAELKAQQEDK